MSTSPRWIAALIRHGDYQQLTQTPSAHQPFPLTDRGVEQASALKEPILAYAEAEGLVLDPVIDTSQLLRGWQTADLLCQGLGEAYRVDSFAALAERGLGCAANLRVSMIESILRADPRFEPPPADWKSNSHYQLPLQGAESLMQAGERVADHIKGRMEEQAGRQAQDCLKLFVGHGAAFRHAAYQMGVLSFEDIARYSMFHCSPIYIEWRGGEWVHLAGEWKIRGKAKEPLD
jgi:2,3-bisphosphoglycerate-dependent phosphoglycerate mutase